MVLPIYDGVFKCSYLSVAECLIHLVVQIFLTVVKFFFDHSNFFGHGQIIFDRFKHFGLDFQKFAQVKVFDHSQNVLTVVKKYLTVVKKNLNRQMEQALLLMRRKEQIGPKKVSYPPKKVWLGFRGFVHVFGKLTAPYVMFESKFSFYSEMYTISCCFKSAAATFGHSYRTRNILPRI